MTDEEYGRAWAEMTGRKPGRGAGRFIWDWHNGGTGTENQLPAFLHQMMFDERDEPTIYPAEAAAFEALGRAVREVHRLVPMLPGEVI